MSLPDILFVIELPDGSIRAYANESEVGAPLDSYVDMATYTIDKVEQVRRVVSTTLDKKAKLNGPAQPANP